MTVIAFKSGIMAADTMLSGGNSQNRAQKLVRLPDGGVAGGCGLWRNAYSALKYLEEGGDADATVGVPKVDDATILIARPDGSLWLIEDAFPAFPIRDAVASVGCGSDAALMAMSLGLSPVEAVGRVTRQDVFCGDPVQSMAVVTREAMPGIKTHAMRAPKPKRKPKK